MMRRADVRLSAMAQADIIDILFYTLQEFGTAAHSRYERLIFTALEDLADNPLRVGSFNCLEAGESVRNYHLKHSRARARLDVGIVLRPRHFVLYRFSAGTVAVGRVLHDAMELARHLPDVYGDE